MTQRNQTWDGTADTWDNQGSDTWDLAVVASGGDQLRVGLTETVLSRFITTYFTSSDTLRVQSIEYTAAIINSFLNRIDSLGVKLIEVKDLLGLVNRSDQLRIALTETRGIASQTLAIDSIRVGLTDALLGLPGITIIDGGTLNVRLVEATPEILAMLERIDSLRVRNDDSGSMAVYKIGPEIFYINLVEEWHRCVEDWPQDKVAMPVSWKVKTPVADGWVEKAPIVVSGWQGQKVTPIPAWTPEVAKSPDWQSDERLTPPPEGCT